MPVGAAKSRTVVPIAVLRDPSTEAPTGASGWAVVAEPLPSLRRPAPWPAALAGWLAPGGAAPSTGTKEDVKEK